MNKITLENSNDYLLWRKGSGRSLEIYDIAVNSERRKGRGRELINKLLEALKHDSETRTTSVIFAITRISNTKAHQFYEACGFRIAGRLQNFYRDGYQTEQALMYALDI